MQRHPEHVLASIRKYKVERWTTNIVDCIMQRTVITCQPATLRCGPSFSFVTFVCSPCLHVMQGDGMKPGHRTLEWDKTVLSNLDCVQLAKDFNGIVVSCSG